jgi:hypothetical protein
MAWIKTLQLYGNYRDLQKIAIYYKTFLTFDNDTRKMIKQHTAFEFAKNEFDNYISSNQQNDNDLFNLEKDPQILVENYKNLLAKRIISQYGNAKKAAKNFNEKGFKITDKTLLNWTNKKPSKI